MPLAGEARRAYNRAYYTRKLRRQFALARIQRLQARLERIERKADEGRRIRRRLVRALARLQEDVNANLG